MGWRHRILIVAAHRGVGSTLAAWFDAAGYEVVVCSTFIEAKANLLAGPDLLVAELKLGEYNGLHLAARAYAGGIPAVVIGPSDIVLERDAELLGALYLTTVRKSDLLDIVEHQLTIHPVDVVPLSWAQSQGYELPAPAHDDATCRFVDARRPHTIAGRSPLAN